MSSPQKYPPGKYGHPIAGNLKDLRLRVLDFFCSLQEQFGDVSTVRFSIRKVSYIQHPDIIQHVLQENNRNYTKSLRYEQLRYLLGNGLLTSEGEFWLRQRRMIQPGFHKHKLESLADQMVSCTAALISQINNSNLNKPRNIAGDMMALTLQIVGKTLLNSDMQSEAKTMADSLGFLLKAVNVRTRTPILIPLWVPLPHHTKIKKAVSTINQILDKVFDERRKSKGEYHDLLSMLMEARYEDSGEHMKNEQLRDEVMTLFVAGHETTANALSWTVYLLSKHNDVLLKCKKEVDEVLHNNPPSFNTLSELKYITMVIEESMRLYPPAWIIGRKTVKPDQLGDYKVAADHNILICPYALHRDNRYWNNPLEFIPERFADDSIKKKTKFAYLPFGGGPRMCIGNNFAMMEMQIVVAMLVQNFDIRSDQAFTAETDALITLRPKNGISVYMEAINSHQEN